MTDLTPSFNQLLGERGSAQVRRYRYSTEQLDDFLKEAYSIHARILDLTAYLRANRAAYLSTSTNAPRPGRHDLAQAQRPSRALTDVERAEIDAHSKTMIRQLSGAIGTLADAEKVRSDTKALVTARKRNRNGLGALGRWAAGGVEQEKTPQELAEEAKERAFTAHREGVIWYLQKRLGEAGVIQAFMIETRLQREEEKAKSVLYKAKGSELATEQIDSSSSRSGMPSSDFSMLPEDMNEELTEEQLQQFAEENQGMLKHLGQQLDQVRAVHKSLEEISQLQSSLMANLDSQNANIDQLVQDSFFTEENVGRGNKELKKASERTSTAKLWFHSTCVLCSFLVVWDLIF